MNLSDHPTGPQSITSIQTIPIVAIGASAGGPEAVSELLMHLSPTSGWAFIYIQPTDTDQPDQLLDRLAPLTQMPVLDARDRMHIHPNHVYIIPVHADVHVVNGQFIVKERPQRPAHLPIDLFFISLAEQLGAASVGVLLSGKSADGTLGLKAIKAANGITFAQDGSAKFQGMSVSAQAEGVVDKVLPVREIAHELDWLSRQQSFIQDIAVIESPDENDQPESPEPDNGELMALLQLLRKFVGVDFTHYKTATIRRRVLRRMALYKLRLLTEYMDYLRQHPTEAGLLYNDLLINVTSFFRDPETMEYLGKVLFPQLLASKPESEPFRLWIPACSTGEEVYSLAILLLEAQDILEKPVPTQIFATDLSERVIARARMGRFSASQLANVSPKRLNRFFTKDQDGYCVSKIIRDVCVFATHNLFVDPPFSRLDLISCRNLLIYTDTSLQRKAIATFHYALNPTGYLILGKAETVGSYTRLFTQVAKTFKVYARKTTATRSVFPFGDLLHKRSIIESPPDTDGQQELANTAPTLTLSAPLSTGYTSDARNKKALQLMSMQYKPGQPDDLDQRVNGLLSQYTPASVVINKDMEIIRFQGSTSLFLEPAPGRANFNLLKMARPELVFDLRAIIGKAHKSGQPASKTGLLIRVREETYHITITAVPFLSQNQEPLVLVIFNEVTPAVIPPTAPTQLRNRRIKQLEDELVTLREEMRSMLEEQEAGREELQSANEEIISSNEELQSINEELETSKEEIQSNNEELQTINQELQLSNDQLSEAYDYSDAIFGTIRETVLVLDKDLRVRTANRAFFKTFRVEADESIGRLLYELGNRQWDIPALRLLLDKVINHNTPIQSYEMTHHFQDLGEKVLRLNARKVVRLQGQAAILLAIEDITDHSQVQRLLVFLQSILTHAPVSIQLFKSVRNERNTIVDFQLVPLVNELGQRTNTSVEELYKTSFKALYNDTKQISLFTQYVQVVETGDPLQIELPNELAQQPEWHQITANRFEDGILLVTSTISKRHRR